MKYVMFEKIIGIITFKIPIVFPQNLVHADMAAALTAKGAPLEGFKPVSAGEYSTLNGHCAGRSSTLDLDSDPDDIRDIKFNDYGAGMS